METDKIRLGLAQHFHLPQWTNETEYLQTVLSSIEDEMKLHVPDVRTAFLNIQAFLKKVDAENRGECVKLFDTILGEDPSNLNALVGLYEFSARDNEKERCVERVNGNMQSDLQKRAVAKALLEIGLALCILVPRRPGEYMPMTNTHESYDAFHFNDINSLEFTTETIPMDTALFTSYNKAQTERRRNAIRYLSEGLHRLVEVENEHLQDTNEMVWKYFLAVSYNQLRIPYISDSSKRQKTKFVIRSIELFSEVAQGLNPDEDNNYKRLYFKRSLAYIGQMIAIRKELLIPEEDFQRLSNHSVLYGVFNSPETALTRARKYGYDRVVWARHASILLHEEKYDSVIQIIKEIARKEHGRIDSFTAKLRMRAYKRKHERNFKAALGTRSLPSLDTNCLQETEKDGKLLDSNATGNDWTEYAAILRFHGTFPNGRRVSDESKIREALDILKKVYKEQGCLTHYKTHKIRAECYANLGEIDKAIKYTIWNLNATPSNRQRPSLAFNLLVEYFLQKYDATKEQFQKEGIIRQVKYYIEAEIKLCHECIREAEGKIGRTLFDTLTQLIDNYDKKLLDRAVDMVGTQQCSEAEKQLVEDLNVSYGTMLSNFQKWCGKHSESMKHQLELTAAMTGGGPMPTTVKICLKCLGWNHRAWIKRFQRSWGDARREVNVDSLVYKPSPIVERNSEYDFLAIYAPEDEEWICYTLMPEMEERPIRLRGCIPGRDFKSGENDAFWQNMRNNIERSRKFLLVITVSFLKRTYRELEEHQIMDTLLELYDQRPNDIITIQLTRSELMSMPRLPFQNIDALGSSFDWPTLRKLLIR